MAEDPPRMTDEQFNRMMDTSKLIIEAQERKPIPEAPESQTASLTFPPGVAGEIAQFIYSAAPRPVPEVAVVGAMGLLAGICGRQWQLPGSGLNVYLILVARSAIGKEAMLSGVSKLVLAASREVPTASRYVDFTEYASGPALIKACVTNPCFVNVSGEIGRRIKAMSNAKPGDALNTLRTQMTNLFHKSTRDSTVGGLGYSATENNVSSILGVSYSLIGETTPGTFLESLTSEMMEDGFMSRLTVIEYEGERPDRNRAPVDRPPAHLVSNLVALISQADNLAVKDLTQAIGRTESVAVKMDAFEDECDRRIKASGSDESRRQMWNRAALKAARIAGLLAVADHYIAPLINDDHIDWAISLVRRDIATFTKRLNGGDVGDGDDARQSKLVGILRDYLTGEVPDSYRVHPEMWKNNIVPLHYLQKRTRRAPAFSKHRFGANRALEETLSAMIAGSYLMEVDRNKVIDGYGYHGKGFRILHLPDPD